MTAINDLKSKTSQTTSKKTEAMNNEVSMVEMCKSQLDIQVKTNIHRNIEITNEIICDCAKQQTAARKTCHNVVWVFCTF